MSEAQLELGHLGDSGGGWQNGGFAAGRTFKSAIEVGTAGIRCIALRSSTTPRAVSRLAATATMTSPLAAVCVSTRLRRRLVVFGSAVTEEFDERDSDVDFLVDFADDLEDRLAAYFGLKESLEELLHRPVDLVSPATLRNPYFAEAVARQAQELYAA